MSNTFEMTNCYSNPNNTTAGDDDDNVGQHPNSERHEPLSELRPPASPGPAPASPSDVETAAKSPKATTQVASAAAGAASASAEKEKEKEKEKNTQAAPPASSGSPTWTDQMLAYLNVMARSKKTAPNKEVAAYYSHQRHVIQRLMELNELQASDSSKTVYQMAHQHRDGSSCVPVDLEREANGADDHHHHHRHGHNSSELHHHHAHDHMTDEDHHHGVESPNAAAAPDDEEEDEGEVQDWAARLSLMLNVCLLGVKIFASVHSGSLTVIASLLDSALDLFSGTIMVIVEWYVAHADPDEYPTGKHHFESIGTLIFSCCMFVASAKLVENSATTLADIDSLSLEIDTITIAIMCSVVASKFIAWLFCRSSESTMVLALAADHRNDVMTNTVGVAGIFLARYVSRYFDPSVALVTTLFIMYVWGSSALRQATALSGKMAEPEYLNELTLLARNCDPRLVAVDTVRAVTSGTGYIAEIDLVLPPEMPLREAHDIGEKLQLFLEKHKTLGIARAYVHLDHETEHSPRRHQ